MEQTLLDRLLRGAPPLEKGMDREINALFPSYLFRRRRTREVWASCCGSYGVLPPESALMAAAHTPELKPFPMLCHAGLLSAPRPTKPPEPGICPFCGRESPVKELGRSGNRKNLWSFRHVVVLRWYRGALWASAYEAVKDYSAPVDLAAGPRLKLLALYRFRPGLVEWCRRPWDAETWPLAPGRLETSGLRPDFKLPKPFSQCAEYGSGYDLLGLEQVERSPFRWCGAETYLRRSNDILRYLTVCTAWPRQVELLTKAGLVEAVVDFAVRGKRNAAAFNWYDPDPRNGLGLGKVELRDFLAGDRSLEVLAQYRSLRRAGLPATLPELYELKAELGKTWFQRSVIRARRLGLSPGRLLHYLRRTQAEDQGSRKRPEALRVLAGWWCDYIDDAQALGLDLKNEVYRLPRGLRTRHRETSQAAQVVREQARRDEERGRDRDRLRTLVKRYTYWDDRWLVRPPLGPAEIVEEGKALKHCVGGYADRHRRGVVTILFLRDRQRPGRSLVTIEMSGSEIVQIHGWDNERSACKDNPKQLSPWDLYRDFLDGWLFWLKAGSPRDQQGRPMEVWGGSNAAELRPA